MGFRTVLFSLLLTLSSLAGASDLPDLSKTPGAVRSDQYIYMVPGAGIEPARWFYPSDGF
jgi:hypothetical protein